MNNFIYAHVFTDASPLTEPESLKGKVVQSEIAGNSTWTLDIAALLSSDDPGAVDDEFRQWRSRWHRTWKLDSEHNVTDLADKLQSQFPVWDHIRAGGVLTNRDSVLLLNDLDDVRTRLRDEKDQCVILTSPDDEGAIWSWPAGFEGVLATAGGTDIAVTGEGLEITRPSCGTDPILGWDIDDAGKISLRHSCKGDARAQNVAPDLEKYLFSLTPGARTVNVLTQPGIISVARTLTRIEQACEMSETLNTNVFLTSA